MTAKLAAYVWACFCVTPHWYQRPSGVWLCAACGKLALDSAQQDEVIVRSVRRIDK